jgi:hypothetical protein
MRSDGDDPDFKDVHVDNTELLHLEHFFIWGHLNNVFFRAKSDVNNIVEYDFAPMVSAKSTYVLHKIQKEQYVLHFKYLKEPWVAFHI